ncbi:MAG: DUF4147 domain-containing protein, partial [Sphingopyxis terrae]
MEGVIATEADQVSQTSQRDKLIALFRESVRAVSPEVAMPRKIPHSPHGRTVVIAVGKAAAEMMRVAQDRAEQPLKGLVVTRHG